MRDTPPTSPLIHATRFRLLSALLVFVVLNVFCSGDSARPAGTDSAATQAGTGSVPLYEASTQLLTLPQLRMGDAILTDVKLSLKPQGNSAVVSKGASRPRTPSDSPAANLDAPDGNSDLRSSPEPVRRIYRRKVA